MGYAFVEPEEAAAYIDTVMRRQQQDGFITQWYMTDGSPKRALCLLNHTDGPIWLILSAAVLIAQLGDIALYDRTAAYIDGGEGTVQEHLFRAAEYMYHSRGSHGLCLIGDGDWTDPINGPGRGGKGESVWTTMALIYAMMQLAESGAYSQEQVARLVMMMTELRNRLNEHVWSKDRYVVALDDEGYALGSVEDNDRIFLNTQTWAIMAGVPTPERLSLVRKTIAKLATPLGPLLLDRPFFAWDERWGRISIKKSGTTENGAVYSHATMFKAFSDAVLGDGDALYEALWRTLPTNPDNPPEVSLQVPLYLSNYCYSLQGSPNFGISSGNYGTGTVSWMLLVILEHLAGVRATPQGIVIDPCLPAQWDHVRCVRHFGGAVYEVEIRRSCTALGEDAGGSGSGTAAEKLHVTVDGVPVTGVLPCEPGRTYQVSVEI